MSRQLRDPPDKQDRPQHEAETLEIVEVGFQYLRALGEFTWIHSHGARDWGLFYHETFAVMTKIQASIGVGANEHTPETLRKWSKARDVYWAKVKEIKEDK